MFFITKKGSQTQSVREPHFFSVGVIGFEPTTLCSQSRCASQAALHPVRSISAAQEFRCYKAERYDAIRVWEKVKGCVVSRQMILRRHRPIPTACRSAARIHHFPESESLIGHGRAPFV